MDTNNKEAVAVEVVKEETKEVNPNVITIPLKKNIEINGQSVDELILDFSNMTGADILAVDTEMRIEGHPAGFTSIYDTNACLKLAARAVGTVPDDLIRLHPAEFLEMILQVRNFFIQW
ncbi:MAG: hypothetical protein ABS920_07230 [Sporosarcina sp.]